MMGFRERLASELNRRRANNSRYSLRAFSVFLGTDHSTLSQILRGTRTIPTSRLRLWGRKLGMTREEVAAYIVAEHMSSEQEKNRQDQLRHWAAEALAIVTDSCHWEIVERTYRPGFRGDCRVISKEVGVSVDRVNVALARLLRLRLLELGPRGRWKNLLGSRRTEPSFRKLALIRIRELAAKDGIKLRLRS
jgi:transcriptional regulator with XRE-family HTH domain